MLKKLLYILNIYFYLANTTTLEATSAPSKVPTPTRICSTIHPITQLTESFLQRFTAHNTHAETFSVIPPTDNPHYFEPKISTLHSLKNVSIWIRCGEPIEERIKETIVSAIVIDLRDYIQPIPSACCQNHIHHHDTHEHSLHTHNIDTHYWLSINNLKKICSVLYLHLAKELNLDPIQAKAILDEDIAKIDTLETKIKQLVPNKTIITNHPLLNYFCHDLGFKTESTEPPGNSLTLKQSQKLTSLVQEEKIQTILLIHPYSTALATKFAEQNKLSTKEFNPYTLNPINALQELTEILKI